MMRWAEKSFPELGTEAPGAVAILPLGAIEAHGPHLPVGSDVWIAEAMAESGRAIPTWAWWCPATRLKPPRTTCA